jgi:uncharacterized protein YjbI with pentapeptide repeats/beta-lactamase regulating signal transducer with metallopeptidase domain
LAATVVVPIATTLPFLATSPPAAATPAVKAHVLSVTRASAASAPQHHVDRPETIVSDGRPLNSPVNRPIPQRLHLSLPIWPAIVAASVWALIAFGGLLQLAVGLFRLERLKRDALPLPIEYRDAMTRWNAALKGHRDVRLCVSEAIDVPVAVGLFDSMILIPRSLLDRLSPEEVDQIALHELAHLHRADDWTNGLQRIVMAVVGWNPSVRFAAAQLDLEREVACDDYVLSSPSVVRPYAMCLAKMAESSSWPRRPMAAPAVFATRKHLSLRIERLLFAGRVTGTHASIGAAAFAVAAMATVGVALGAIAPSVAASSQYSSVPATAAALVHRQAQAVREIVRYVNVPRTVQVAQTTASSHVAAADSTVAGSANAAAQRSTATARAGATAIADATAQPLSTMQPMPSAHPQPLAHPAASMHPVHALATPLVRPDGIAIHIPAMHFPGIDVSIPKIALDRTNGTGDGRSCSGCDQHGMDLRGRDLRGVNYTGVDLTKANLDGADLSGGTFTGVDFSHAQLRGASFRNARLNGCDFSGADLSNADFAGATVSNCAFTHAKLSGAAVRSIVATCSGCDFTGSTLGAVDLSNIHVSQMDFSGADLMRANLSGSSFVEVDFTGARMSGANVVNTTFTDCDLTNTGLRKADLLRAKMIDTDYPDGR